MLAFAFAFAVAFFFVYQVEEGPWMPVEVEDADVYCEYWINPKFQTCLRLNSKKHHTNVFLIEGKYYERGAAFAAAYADA